MIGVLHLYYLVWCMIQMTQFMMMTGTLYGVQVVFQYLNKQTTRAGLRPLKVLKAAIDATPDSLR